MKYRMQIPASAISAEIEGVKQAGLIGTENIGEVHLAGDWNNWGDSPQKAGFIRPKPETLMELQGQFYVLDIEVPVGLHDCKPVVVKAGADADGMVAAAWTSCPDQADGFTPHGRQDNWQFVVE